MVPDSGNAGAAGSNKSVYTEYMLINGAFERIGTSDADLSNYFTKDQVTSAITNAKGEAAADAQTKADAAKNAAIAAAATDATTKANAAKDAAITEAGKKADKALEDAKAYSDGLAKNYATADQGAKADSALQAADVVEGTVNGAISVKGAPVKVHGLGTAAYAATGDFATAAQGTKADTAVQAADVISGTANGTISVKGKDVAVKGLGSAAYQNSGAFDASGAASDNVARHVWFSDSTTETARVSDDNFKYNPSGNLLTTNISGNAATASSVAWENVSGKPGSFTPASHTHDDRYYTESEINTKLNAKANSSHTHTKSQITDFPTSMPASDVYSWAKQSNKPSYTIGEVSGNLDVSRLSGVIDAAHLPSYVDDVIEGYLNGGKFYTTKSSSGTYSGEIKAEAGKIYVDLSNNKTYRWSGSTYVVISETIALGTTHATAGYGDESRAAYNHSTSTGNPHKTTKADLGLANVENKSSATIRGELTSANVTTALGYTPPRTDTNTHYTTRIVAGATNGTANAATTNGNTHINVTDDNTFRSGVVIKGTGATSVTSDTSGNITVHSTDTDTWRPIQNNLTSTATDQSLSAAQGKALNDKFSSYVPTSRTVNGKALSSNISLSAGDVGAAPASHSHSYLPLTGGTMSGRILRGAGGSWISARSNAIAFGTTANSGSYNPVVGQKTTKGAWTVGNLAGDERLVFSYDTDTNFNAGNNASNATYLPIGNASQEIITSATIGSQSVNYANYAGSVAWTNVSGRPSSMPASDVYAWAKASNKPSYSWSEISGKPSIPSVGNGTITITQNGVTKGSFTLNQSGNATIALTDNDTNTWRPEEVIISSTQPSASTCKLWIKI